MPSPLAITTCLLLRIILANGELYGESAPTLNTGNKEYDWAHDLALSETRQNIADDRSHFFAGHGWGQLWTRDVSYAAEQAASFLYPDVVRSSLEASVEVDELSPAPNKLVWLQDVCHHFGGWPNLSDAIVGARGAWSLYKVDGNRTFLHWAYEITKNSLVRGERDVFNEESGLFQGCSSFMESNSGYPMGYKNNGGLVGRTKALSTNILYYSGYDIARQMAQELEINEDEISSLRSKAEALKHAVRERLWSSSMGDYAYFEDENGELMDRMEGLGLSFALLEIESDPDRIFNVTHQTEYGLPCLWPQFYSPLKGIASYYHNGRLWPFVQGFWAVAAAKHRRADVFAHALSSLKELAVRSQTFAEFYELDGTFPPGRMRQLWSATGYLGMIYQGLFGMTFEADRILFAPVKPLGMFADEVVLHDFQYRGMLLDITIKGEGSDILRFLVDGEDVDGENVISSHLGHGRHQIEIHLK